MSENSNEVGEDPYHHSNNHLHLHHHRVIPEILPDTGYEDEGITEKYADREKRLILYNRERKKRRVGNKEKCHNKKAA